MRIELHEVNKSFNMESGQLQVLSGLSLEAEKGSFTAVIGPSGCGKSTILHLLAGMLTPDSGRIVSEGRAVLMPQEDMLLPWRTVLQNAVLGAELAGGSLAQSRQKAEGLLPLCGLRGFGKSYPAQLSGGMRQRAALLRTYLAGGDFWLLDEPFGKLDALTRESLQVWLLGVARAAGAGIVLVTHDLDEAVFLADSIYALSPRPGKVIGHFRLEHGAERRRDTQELLLVKNGLRDLLARYGA
ncbi:MAG: ATP-binding cassette domain-containing protein [Clostridiales bacterium]|nr:ATP-binding cassette domain-containing protein [Clostridiales bacterium]